MIALIANSEQIDELFRGIITAEDFEALKYDTAAKMVQSLKNVSHYSHIVIDVNEFSSETEELLSGLYLLRSTNSTPLILVVRGKLRGDPFLSRLVELKLYNFITAVDTDTARRQVQECMAGRTESDVLQYMLNTTVTTQKRSWFSRVTEKGKSNKLTVAVAGVFPRMGTTTAAIRVSRFLSQGKRNNCCYIETGDKGHVSVISRVYSDAVTDENNIVQYSGLRLAPCLMPKLNKQYDCLVFDCGTDFNSELFFACDVKIITAGSTAWEMAALAPLLSASESEDERCFLFTFTGKEEKQDLLSFMGERWQRTFFAEYCPDMFAELTGTETEIYSKLLYDR